MHPTMDSKASKEELPAAVDSAGPADVPSPSVEPGSDADEVLARYEAMFASRYTEEDPAYRPYINKGMDPPPIVEHYHVRRQRQNWNDSRDQWQTRDRGYKRDHRETGQWDDRNRQKRRYDGRGYQDRDWAHRGHPQEWRGWGGRGQAWQPQGGQRERWHDDRQQGRPWGSYPSRHGPSQGRSFGRPEPDEWT